MRSVDKEEGFSKVCACSQMSSSALTSGNLLYITIVQSYTGKYHKFVAVCIVTSNNANGNKRVMFFPLDFIIRTLDFIACSDTDACNLYQ